MYFCGGHRTEASFSKSKGAIFYGGPDCLLPVLPGEIGGLPGENDDIRRKIGLPDQGSGPWPR